MSKFDAPPASQLRQHAKSLAHAIDVASVYSSGPEELQLVTLRITDAIALRDLLLLAAEAGDCESMTDGEQ